jgi:hypothetical protein
MVVDACPQWEGGMDRSEEFSRNFVVSMGFNLETAWMASVENRRTTFLDTAAIGVV